MDPKLGGYGYPTLEPHTLTQTPIYPTGALPMAGAPTASYGSAPIGVPMGPAPGVSYGYYPPGAPGAYRPPVPTTAPAPAFGYPGYSPAFSTGAPSYSAMPSSGYAHPPPPSGYTPHATPSSFPPSSSYPTSYSTGHAFPPSPVPIISSGPARSTTEYNFGTLRHPFLPMPIQISGKLGCKSCKSYGWKMKGKRPKPCKHCNKHLC